ncbi:MAG: SMC-Scp complex subunit ScpB [Candidatus Glassbacteria bacterium]|nr:SMC-Scp complex subunit ScpB [Candidatus Glassbacteria bacterium]
MAEFPDEMIVEAMIFASDEPVAARKLAAAAGITAEEVERAVASLNRAYEQGKRAFRILKIAGGYQFRTIGELGPYVQGLGRQVLAGRLSLPALETLAIVAYRQPISRPEIEKVRGVNVSGVLKTLLERKLITITGRAQVLGRPLLYGTTPRFLRHFGLESLENLPRESELQVILARQEESLGEGNGEPGPESEAPGEPDGQQVLI